MKGGIMDVISSITGLFKPVAELVDDITTSDEERLKLGNELAKIQNNIQTKVLELESQLISAQTSVLTTEANAESWLQRNWRPIAMISFLVIVIFDSFGIITIEKERAESLYLLLQIGLGGYIVGRSGEKISKKIGR
jgi:hypothetical protein